MYMGARSGCCHQRCNSLGRVCPFAQFEPIVVLENAPRTTRHDVRVALVLSFFFLAVARLLANMPLSGGTAA